MKHSTIYFKGNEWAFDQRSENQLRINRKLDSITIRPFTLHHKDESITFNGMASKHNNYKDLHLVFDKVDINKIIPAIDNLDLAGVLNGHLSLMQDRNKYTPEADLTLKSFMLNKYEMGDLQANISGNEDLTSFKTKLEFLNGLGEGLLAQGNIFIKDANTYLDLRATLTKLNLKPFGPFYAGYTLQPSGGTLRRGTDHRSQARFPSLRWKGCYSSPRLDLESLI